ncbi:MAG: hypothetical protein ACMUIG_10750, partial [Thermoplasmatota archaeon]
SVSNGWSSAGAGPASSVRAIRERNTALWVGIIGGLLTFIIYSLALGAMMIVFSYIAASGSKTIGRLVSSTDKIKKASSVLLVLAGLFVIWYYFFGSQLFGDIFQF